MRFPFLALLVAIACVPQLHAADEFIRDKPGDLKLNERQFDGFDIISVKVSTSDRKSFSFEVKTKSPIKVVGKEACYFIVAVNVDGDLATGVSAWTPGQDFGAFIDIDDAAVKKVRDQRGDSPAQLSGAVVEGNVLRFTLTHDATKQKRMTFNVRSMVRRQSAEGKSPYTVLDSSVGESERFNEFKF